MSRKSAKKRRNRRIIGGAITVAVVVAGGAFALTRGAGTDEQGPEASEGELSERGYLEPPIFADLVASGELPPIDERLPVEPFVVGDGVLLEQEYLDWEDGRYGGSIEFAGLGATGFVNIAGGASFLRSPGQSTEASLPNILSEFEHGEDYTSYTMTIRDGLRWSDGEPVTTEDVRFTMEDIYGNPEANRPAPTWLYTQGDPSKPLAELTVVDELTFELTFAEPYGQFVADLNSWIPGYTDLLKPAHYLKQFHADYADPAELEALIEENDRSDWQTLLEYKDVSHWDVGDPRALGLPTLNAWILVESGENLTSYERNPYFWHVDSSGHQLPYIDSVVNNRVVDTDAQTNAILAGQVSLASGGEASLSNMSVYTQNAERSGLRIFTTGSFNNPLQLFLNRDFDWETQDSQWQSLMMDPDHQFHEAVAASINSAAINDTVYFGLYGDLEERYQQYDPDLAAELLDDLGMTAGSNGLRTYPDGSPFSLQITYSADQADFTPVAELLREQLADVGLDVELEVVDPTLWGQRKDANQIQASITWNDGQGWASGISEDYLPAHKGPWAQASWMYFLTNGDQGRPLDPAMQEFFELHTARKEVPPQSAEGVELWSELDAWLVENYAFIPITGPKVTPTVADATLQNLPVEGSPVELDVYINAEGLWYADE